MIMLQPVTVHFASASKKEHPTLISAYYELAQDLM